jgi:hypothetical protein
MSGARCAGFVSFLEIIAIRLWLERKRSYLDRFGSDISTFSPPVDQYALLSVFASILSLKQRDLAHIIIQKI